MKKLLALVLAALMALSLATMASAIIITPDTEDEKNDDQPETMYFGGDTLEIPLIPGEGFVEASDSDYFLIMSIINSTDSSTDTNTDDAVKATATAGTIIKKEYAVSASASSSKPDMLKASIVSDKDSKGKKGQPGYEESIAYYLKLDPADEYFTVEEHKVEVKVVVVQKEKTPGSETKKAEIKFDVLISNESHGKDDFWKNADGKVEAINELSKPVIDKEVFTDLANGKSLTLDYGKYAIKFAKVSRQNTSLYLKAKTDVVSVEHTKAIGSIGFKPTRVKDAATITMPISPDNENYYGETVYVYAVTDGKPTGAAIKADVVNHSYVVFTVPAGTTLGTFAAYGSEKLGDAEKPAPTKNTGKEKPAIPETGAGDIANIAVVFAVVALAGVGFAVVKKAGK